MAPVYPITQRVVMPSPIPQPTHPHTPTGGKIRESDIEVLHQAFKMKKEKKKKRIIWWIGTGLNFEPGPFSFLLLFYDWALPKSPKFSFWFLTFLTLGSSVLLLHYICSCAFILSILFHLLYWIYTQLYFIPLKKRNTKKFDGWKNVYKGQKIVQKER